MDKKAAMKTAIAQLQAAGRKQDAGDTVGAQQDAVEVLLNLLYEAGYDDVVATFEAIFKETVP